MPPRIALFTTECAQLADALTEIITRHAGEIAVVVTSDPYATARGDFLTQLRDNHKRSGTRFSSYLAYSFLLYPFALRVDRLQSRVTGRRARKSVAELCAENGIARIHTGRVNSPEVVRRLNDASLDHIVIYWFDQIIHEAVLAAAGRGVINIHAAHLPRCRGLFPTLYSALERAPFGATAHMIENREVDAGPILAQMVTEPPAGRSVLFNDSWVNRAGVGVFDYVLENFDQVHANRAEQGGGSYYSYPSRAQLRQARQQGIRLATFRDFIAAIRGTGASDAPVQAPAGPVMDLESPGA
jgi:hypothetical protein